MGGDVFGRFHFVDLGWHQILRRVENVARKRADAGVIGQKAKQVHPHRAGSRWQVTLAEAALINEFGSGAGAATYVPERSTLRRAMRRRELRGIGKRAAQMLVLFGNTSNEVVEFLGHAAEDAIRKTLEGRIPPRNAPLTVERKGFDHPMTWYGLLYHAITSRVAEAFDGEGDKG